MREKWTHIRIRQSTKDRIAQFIDSLRRAIDGGDVSVPVGRWDEITADGAISVLLDRDARHKDRKRSHAQRKSRRKAEVK